MRAISALLHLLAPNGSAELTNPKANLEFSSDSETDMDGGKVSGGMSSDGLLD